MKRSVLALLIVSLLTVVAPTVGSVSAQADEEASFITALNQTRAEVGLPALVPHAELTDLSRQWAQTMADAGEIFHANPISAGLDAPWLKLGENVGVGPTISDLMEAFIASPGHYANIIDPEFTHVGVGVVWSGDRMFTTHRFMKMEQAAPTPTTAAPAPSTTAAPPATTGAPSSGNPAPAPPTTAPEAPSTTVPDELAFTDPPRPVAEPERVAVVLRTLLHVDR